VEIRLRPAVRLHWRRWDDEFVVYDEASGLTHRLDALIGSVLLRIEEGLVDECRLTDAVASDLGCPRDAIGRALPEALGQLAGADLIDTRASCG